MIFEGTSSLGLRVWARGGQAPLRAQSLILRLGPPVSAGPRGTRFFRLATWRLHRANGGTRSQPGAPNVIVISRPPSWWFGVSGAGGNDDRGKAVHTRC
jgi:hypothetical protein